jgi:hypothetical protein
MNLLPPMMASVVLIARSFIARGGFASLVRTAVDPQGAGLLTVFWMIGIVSAMFFPRIFANVAEIVPMRGDMVPVGPSLGNFTQLAYLSISYLVTVIIVDGSRDRSFRTTMINAMMLGGAVLLVTGVADFVLGAAQGPYFAPFKTAQYTFMDGSEILGLRRVEGLMSEASSYGPPCIIIATFLLVASSGFEGTWRKITAQAISWGLVITAILSTSSTAYVGVALFAVFYSLNLFARVGAVMGGRKDRPLAWELCLFILGCVGVAIAIMATPEVFAIPMKFINNIILDKPQSDSYAARMAWNKAALDALWATKGVGLGTGTARTSNFAVAVISNEGVLGAIAIFAFFVIQLLKAPLSTPGMKALVRGTKAAVLVALATESLSGTTVDYGLLVAGLLGLLVANTKPVGRRTPMRSWRWRYDPAPRRNRAPAPTLAGSTRFEPQGMKPSGPAPSKG